MLTPTLIAAYYEVKCECGWLNTTDIYVIEKIGKIVCEGCKKTLRVGLEPKSLDETKLVGPKKQALQILMAQGYTKDGVENLLMESRAEDVENIVKDVLSKL